jgi:GH25 family lysozyme M1 (1,4-beta-N-acetylmuramidase)
MRSPLVITFMLWAAVGAGAQTPGFNQPWKDTNVAIVIDPFEGNQIDWELLAADKRVVAVIHRATIGDRADKKYAQRKIEAKRRGYKWGAYHLGKPGDPIKQARFFLETVRPDADDLLALDLESTDTTKHMSLAEARVFINHIREQTGRYPFVYANQVVTKTISEKFGADDVFSQTPLWYARFKARVDDFPMGTWNSYTLWQFSSEINCARENRTACLYTVPGTEHDIDVNVFNGTIDELRRKWPFALPGSRSESVTPR